MKKMSFWLMMLMLGLSTALWTGCSDDDNGEGNEQGGGEQGGSTVTKDTTWMVDTIRVNWLDDEGFYTKISLTRDKDDQVTKVDIADYSPKGLNGEPKSYPITERTKDKVTIAFHDEDMDADVNVVYSLNAKGFVTNIVRTAEYDSDTEFKFNYNEKDQLLDIVMTYEDESAAVFKATYDDKGNWKTLLMAPADDEGEIIGNCIASAKINNYSADLNMLMWTDNTYYAYDMVQCAVYMGLLPSTPNILSSVSADGETVAVTAVEKDKRIETIKMEHLTEMVLTTRLKETDKK